LNTDHRRDERPSSVVFVAGLFVAAPPAPGTLNLGFLGFESLGFVRFREYRPGACSPLPRRFDTSRHGQPGQARAGHSTGDSLGAVPEMRPSWGLLTAFSRLCVAGVLRFVCASWWCLCGFRAALGRGFSWVHLGFLACSSPVLPLLGVHFRPFPSIRVLGYPLPLQELGKAALWRVFRLCQIPPRVGFLVVRSLFDC
jgi:hypothetical protein